MLLYPLLPLSSSTVIVNNLLSISIEQAYEESNLQHIDSTYAPTGGNRVSISLLETIQQEIRKEAQLYGYPENISEQNKRIFDASSGKILHTMMGITPSEASHQGVWRFISCILLPDIVRWRFPGSTGITTKERFLGGNRGLRNTFGRVWWRAYTLKQPDLPNPYLFLYLLGEDELVQIMERPNLSASPFLARQVCKSFLETLSQHPQISRSDLLRDTMKRLRRLLPIIAFDALDSSTLCILMNEIFGDAVNYFHMKNANGNEPI